MAGGGALGRPDPVKKGKKSKRKKKKRIGFHLDMTPLVDITFLLLTFFMFTTTMLKPQIMEMKMPPESKEQIDVKASELMSIYVRDDGKVFYAIGLDEPEPIEMKDILKLAVNENLKPNKKNRLITVLKVMDNAQYNYVIQILDQLNLAEIPITQDILNSDDPKTGKKMERSRKFTFGVITEEEIQKLSNL